VCLVLREAEEAESISVSKIQLGIYTSVAGEGAEEEEEEEAIVLCLDLCSRVLCGC
jgi:hypothetical protein